ncbi:hypothetical protein [Archangium sp.]|uniref:hypothetical protein n=1 Tax=Archangium sp. TaxID=1872627 RepID=UPI002D22664D|nr:hypothetical protein [Archangium sp.]HYO55636.1 hypothetical protein [Archangium sp.]
MTPGIFARLVLTYILGVCPEIAAHADAIFGAIKRFFEDFRVASHLDDVVFDAFAEPKTRRLQDPSA